MEVKSLTDCLNKIENMIFDKTFKYLVKDDLELIRNHIEWEHGDVIARGGVMETCTLLSRCYRK